MSGGPYGRGKAPERACMPVRNWPDADQRPWQASFASADVLSEEFGVRSNYAAISNRKIEKGYGRWLTDLQVVDLLSRGLAFARQPRHRHRMERRHLRGAHRLGERMCLEWQMRLVRHGRRA